MRREKMELDREDRSKLESQILDRFIRYVKIDTQSDESAEGKPTTAKQWDLINLLSDELRQLGLKDLTVTENGFLIARIPSTIDGPQPPAIGFMAHVDTAGDMSGTDVNPQIISSYDGKDIKLGEQWILPVSDNPHLLDWVGKTVITSDGSTLLGADDKAGVAEIMAAASYLSSNPQIEHGEIEIIFTCDEETGHGMDDFPLTKLRSRCCYTMDGGRLGEIESACFNAEKVDITFTGVMYHPGAARGRMVNALTMASRFCSMIPQAESPEATDGLYGYYYLHSITGDSESCSLQMNLRDFTEEGIKQRQETLRSIADAVESSCRGGHISLSFERQYSNMSTHINKDPLVMEILEQVVSEMGIEPIQKPIRGGTDGSRLSEMGIPSPNIFAGGLNFHSRYEWIALPAMTEASMVIINLITAWSRQRS
jgi:tripeptide aminopeptidase